MKLAGERSWRILKAAGAGVAQEIISRGEPPSEVTMLMPSCGVEIGKYWHNSKRPVAAKKVRYMIISRDLITAAYMFRAEISWHSSTRSCTSARYGSEVAQMHDSIWRHRRRRRALFVDVPPHAAKAIQLDTSSNTVVTNVITSRRRWYYENIAEEGGHFIT